jgi:cysteine synthase A
VDATTSNLRKLEASVSSGEKIAGSVLDLIANTPIVRLNRVVPDGAAEILAKVESLNPAGSVKDRIALSMIEDAEARGAIKPGDTLVEPTSGNTGIGLAMVAAVKGYRLILTMPEDMSVERRRLLQRFGAELVLTPAHHHRRRRSAEEGSPRRPGRRGRAGALSRAGRRQAGPDRHPGHRRELRAVRPQP